MKLTINKHEAMGDWYLIERAEHDGRSWTETHKVAGYQVSSLCLSSRFSHNADVEGTGAEMLAIAEAIEKRGCAHFKRCAVTISVKEGKAFFSSPRNSEDPGVVSLAEADELAKLIRETVKE